MTRHETAEAVCQEQQRRKESRGKAQGSDDRGEVHPVRPDTRQLAQVCRQPQPSPGARSVQMASGGPKTHSSDRKAAERVELEVAGLGAARRQERREAQQKPHQQTSDASNHAQKPRKGAAPSCCVATKGRRWIMRNLEARDASGGRKTVDPCLMPIVLAMRWPGTSSEGPGRAGLAWEAAATGSEAISVPAAPDLAATGPNWTRKRNRPASGGEASLLPAAVAEFRFGAST